MPCRTAASPDSTDAAGQSGTAGTGTESTILDYGYFSLKALETDGGIVTANGIAVSCLGTANDYSGSASSYEPICLFTVSFR
jgi:hypothetical protein